MRPCGDEVGKLTTPSPLPARGREVPSVDPLKPTTNATPEVTPPMEACAPLHQVRQLRHTLHARLPPEGLPPFAIRRPSSSSSSSEHNIHSPTQPRSSNSEVATRDMHSPATIPESPTPTTPNNSRSTSLASQLYSIYHSHEPPPSSTKHTACAPSPTRSSLSSSSSSRSCMAPWWTIAPSSHRDQHEAVARLLESRAEACQVSPPSDPPAHVTGDRASSCEEAASTSTSPSLTDASSRPSLGPSSPGSTSSSFGSRSSFPASSSFSLPLSSSFSFTSPLLLASSARDPSTSSSPSSSSSSLTSSEKADIQALYAQLLQREREQEVIRRERKRKWVWEDERHPRRRSSHQHRSPELEKQNPNEGGGHHLAPSEGDENEATDGPPRSADAARTQAEGSSSIGGMPGSPTVVDIGGGLKFMQMQPVPQHLKRQGSLPCASPVLVSIPAELIDDPTLSAEAICREAAANLRELERCCDSIPPPHMPAEDDAAERRQRQCRQEELARCQAKGDAAPLLQLPGFELKSGLWPPSEYGGHQFPHPSLHPRRIEDGRDRFIRASSPLGPYPSPLLRTDLVDFSGSSSQAHSAGFPAERAPDSSISSSSSSSCIPPRPSFHQISSTHVPSAATWGAEMITGPFLSPTPALSHPSPSASFPFSRGLPPRASAPPFINDLSHTAPHNQLPPNNGPY